MANSMYVHASNITTFLNHKTYIEALLKNREITEKWESFKKENENVVPTLQKFQKDLKVDILVPIGKKALMRGHLVHTNEVLISLGDGWFVRDSADNAIEVCKRRIKRCEEFLEKLSKERNLLESRRDYSLGVKDDVFASDGVREIIEPLDELKEKEWREKHQQSLKNEAKQKAIQRQEIEKDTEGLKEAWDRLDELELLEELNSELDKTKNDSGNDSDLDSDDESDECPDSLMVVPSNQNQMKKTLIEEISPVNTFNALDQSQTTQETTQSSTRKISKFKASRSLKK